MNPDRGIKPTLLEVKKVYQYIGFSDKDLSSGIMTIENKYAFRELDSFDFSWKIRSDGKTLQSGTIHNVDLSRVRKEISSWIIRSIRSRERNIF